MTTNTTTFSGAKLARPVMLAIDLDESFTQSDSGMREQLFGLIEESADDVRLVYMSHDSAENLIGLAASAELPVPEVFMADSGTTVLKGDGTGTIEPLQRNIIQLWPGKEAVQKALNEIEGVSILSDDAQCRQAFKAEGEEAIEQVRAKVDSLGCSFEPRGENEYYVMPYGVEKGSTLGRYLVESNIAPTSVLAFGETEGDQCLFGRGWRGAIFSHAPQSLKDTAGRFHNVHVLEESGAIAVLQALRSHGWLEMAAKA